MPRVPKIWIPFSLQVGQGVNAVSKIAYDHITLQYLFFQLGDDVLTEQFHIEIHQDGCKLMDDSQSRGNNANFIPVKDQPLTLL